MNIKTIEKIQAAMDADEEKQFDFAAYDDIDAVRYEFGDMLEPWMIKRVSTDGQEALKVLENIFDTHNPKVRITPFGEEDKERAEKAERWAEYHLSRINQRMGASPIRKLPHMAGKYGRIAGQVDYLPYWLPKDSKKWTTEQKEQMRGGPFCVDLHNPRNVFYSMGKYGLRWVASVTNMSAVEVMEHWGIYDDKSENGKKIQAAMKKIEAMYAEDDELRFIHVDFTSHDRREVSVFKTTANNDIADFENYDESMDRIDIIDSENKVKFLNWFVIECDSSPLLEGMHKGNLFAYKTLLDTVVHSSVMRRAYPPTTVSTTIDGKGVRVDYTGTDPEVKLKPGESVQPFIPPPLDNAVFTLAQEVSGQVESSLGVKKLSGMSAGGNVQFSTVNAIIDLHMNNLEPYKRMAEKALVQIVNLMFKWVEFTDDTVTAYRRMKTAPTQITGEEILMSPEQFDIQNLLVEVLLTAKSDKMAAINGAAQLKQNGFRLPDSELLENIGFVNPEVLASMYEDEQLRVAALQNVIEELKGQTQLKLEAQRMQMQNDMQSQMMQQQQPQDPNAQGPMGQMANPDGSMPSNVEGQGFNTAMGGTPPMMAEPGMTATQVPGARAA